MELTVCFCALRWYRHNPQKFDELETLAKSSCIHVERFQSECPTRWDTSFDSWSGHYRNTQAMRIYYAKNNAAPEPLSVEELELLEDILIVLRPTKTATLLMQQSTTASLASQYLPLLEGLLRQLGSCKTMYLPVLDPANKAKAKTKAVAEMKPLAQKLRSWLHDDYCKMKQKHIVDFNKESLDLLQISSFLDPRHKDLHFLNPSDVASVQAKALRFVTERSEGLAALRQTSAMIAASLPEDGRSAVAEPAGHICSAVGNSNVVPAAVASVSSSSSFRVTDNTVLADLSRERQRKRARAEEQQLAKEAREKAKRDLMAAKAAKEAEAAALARRKRRYARDVNQDVDLSLSRDLFFPPMNEDQVAEQQKRVGEKSLSLYKQIKKEITFYLGLQEEKTWAMDPIAWWQVRQSQMPHLSRAAFTLLGVPGASHALEQAFSRAGKGVDYKRKPRLSGQTAASLIFAHENYRRGHIV